MRTFGLAIFELAEVGLVTPLWCIFCFRIGLHMLLIDSFPTLVPWRMQCTWYIMGHDNHLEQQFVFYTRRFGQLSCLAEHANLWYVTESSYYPLFAR